MAPPFAGFWIRLVAKTVDWLIMVGCEDVGRVVGARIAALVGSESGATVRYVVVTLALIFYPAYFESSHWQATPGKRVVGIIVTDVRGERITFARALGRGFATLLNLLTLGVGWLMAGVTAQKRGLHDFVAGTVVVRSAPTLRRSRWVAIAVCCVVAAPLAWFVSALGLIGDLMLRNEASAIRSLRAIHSAQIRYHQTCGGYARNLPALTRPQQFLSPELAEAETVLRSGYHVSVMVTNEATVIANAVNGCEGAVTGYIAYAVPERPGTTGTRYFAADASGIYEDESASFDKRTPLKY